MLVPTAVALAGAAGQSPATTRKAENLIMIVMNGVRYSDAFGDKNHLYTDNIWNKLRPQGTICTKLENRELTLPIPAQMSLLTGVWHVFANPFSETVRPAFPTLFEYWNSARKDSVNSCYFALSKPKFEIAAWSEHAEFGRKFAPVVASNPDEKVNDNAIYEQALPYIMEKKPSFVFLSLYAAGGTESPEKELSAVCPLEGQKDACGGADGLNSYYESIILMDQIVFDLWDRVQNIDKYKNRTILLVLSSYGRHTDEYYGYGDKCTGCTHLFLLAVGPGIKKNFVSGKARTLVDVCRTAGALCDIPTPYAKGNVMGELFE
jgi:hypothetical protein